jgi:osmotically-inducible protein OsmY
MDTAVWRNIMQTRWTGALCGAALLMSVSMGAQEKPQEKPKETTIVIKDDTTPMIKKGARVVTDATITTAVKTRLMKDEVARGTAIDVETKAGVVTIAGTVPTAADKARIGTLVRKTSGVKKVENQLLVGS